jgi:terminase large subunit-like protein
MAFCKALVLDNGRPMTLEAFQRTVLADYFAGATETVVIMPKKNGKTTLLSALALYHLTRTEDAECVIAASSRDQAKILFNQAAKMVKAAGLDGKTKGKFDIKSGYREIRYEGNENCVMRVLAADADTADGVIPTLALVDELHRPRAAVCSLPAARSARPRGISDPGVPSLRRHQRHKIAASVGRDDLEVFDVSLAKARGREVKRSRNLVPAARTAGPNGLASVTSS